MSTTMLKPEISGVMLGSFELFESLDVATRDEIAKLFAMRVIEKGAYVISEAQSSTEVYFLVSGRVQACAFTQSGKQIHFEELGAGKMFGELTAIDKMERSSDCIAVTSATLAVLSAENFLKLIDEYKPVRDALVSRLVFLVRWHMRKVYEFTTFPVWQRVRFELLRIASKYPATEEGIALLEVPTHAEIASRISTHREAVTRELKILEASGAITWGKGKHMVHDVAQLTVPADAVPAEQTKTKGKK